ncbi:MAG: nucleotidyltransferase family protein [Deltaproteobacteria bacterium]|nr:nucleotidyltransferase family protein [Deltaproteobacteria bacterium]
MTSSKEAELLCLLNLAQLRDADKARALQLAREKPDWPGFFDLTWRNSALILTCRRIRELGIEATGLSEWKDREQELLKSATARGTWATSFLKRASENGIEVIVLKGGLFGSVLYNDPAYKKMNDIDVLVRQSDGPRLANVLRELKFESVGQLLGKAEFDDDSHHCPPFVSPDLMAMVGIHWGLTSPHSVWKPDLDEIWKARTPERVFGANAFRMSWEDNLLHLCIHLPFFKVGVRELADVYNLVLFASPKLDWKIFDERVRRWNAEDAAYRVLTLAHALMPLGIPQDLPSKWKARASSFTIRDTEDRCRLGAALIGTRSVQIGKIEKAFSIFRLTESYSEKVLAWAMTWKLTFWPSAAELPRLVPRYKDTGFASRLKMRLLAGSYCWRAMARDYGQLALCAITVINIGVVLRATLLRPFGKSGESIRKHPAAKLLEALE